MLKRITKLLFRLVTTIPPLAISPVKKGIVRYTNFESSSIIFKEHLCIASKIPLDTSANIENIPKKTDCDISLAISKLA
jgi:hypothetical protein